jgi:hypothetical protein
MNVGDLKKYKDNLYTALSRDLSTFEKNFLLIASGVLAFSLVFIKDIVKIDDSINIWLLLVSWILLSFSVGLMMITFLSSASASDKLWKCVDDFLLNNSKFEDSEVLTNEQTREIKEKTNFIFLDSKRILRLMRYTSASLFVLGCLCFSLFVGINISKEKFNKKFNETQKNMKIKTNNAEIIIDSLRIKINNDTLIFLN